MKNTILLFTLFLSITSISGQDKRKKWPEPKKSTYTVRNYNPTGNGYILRNLKFSSEVRLTQPKRETYEWNANIIFISCEIVGYEYEGVSYSKNELINDFKIHKGNFDPSLKSVRVDFSNRKNITISSLSRGGVGGGQVNKIYYSKYDELSDFKIFEIKIYDDYGSPYIEGGIKRALRIKEQKRKNEDFKFQKELMEKKLKYEKEQIEKEFEQDTDDGAVSRRMAKRRQQQAARKKREFEKSVKRTTKSLGKVFSAGISSLVDGEGSLKFVYGIRNIEGDQPIMSPLGASTLEIGAGFGRIGLSVGYSLVDNQSELDSDSANRRERAFGGTWAFGLDLTIFKFDFLSSDADFGINGEYGFGNLDFQVSTATSDFSTDYSTSFYGIGAQLRFLNFLYVTYGYGKFTTEATRITASGSSDFEPENGFYTKLGFGVKYDFGY